jgi:predicted dienelactone hydrolase
MNPIKLFTPSLAPVLLAVALAAPPEARAQVGRTVLRLAGTEVTMVYPSDAPARPLQMGSFAIQAAVDAPVKPGRYRVVVMSHGTGGSAIADHDQAAAFVREGLVVAQVLRTGDNHRDTRDAGPTAFERGPREVSAVIDALGAHPQWGASLQLDKVGAHGMSAGGAVTLSLAGAPWRLLNLVQHCNAHDSEDAEFCFAGATTPEQRQARQQRNRSAQGAPEVFLPAALKQVHAGRDMRVAVATLSVPVAAIFSAESLASIPVPVGLVTATQDRVLLPRHHSGRVLKHAPQARLLADLPGGHFDVLSPWPDDVAELVAKGYAVGGRTTPGFDAAQRRAAQAAVARFQRERLSAL